MRQTKRQKNRNNKRNKLKTKSYNRKNSTLEMITALIAKQAVRFKKD